MGKILNLKERVHQPFRDALIRSFGTFASNLQRSTDLFLQTGRDEGLSNLKSGAQLPNDSSFVMLATRVFMNFRQLTARVEPGPLYTPAGNLGDVGTPLTVAAMALLLASGNGTAQSPDIYRLYSQAAEQLYWTVGSGEKDSLRSVPTWYLPAGGGIVGTWEGSDAIHYSNGKESHGAILGHCPRHHYHPTPANPRAGEWGADADRRQRGSVRDDGCERAGLRKHHRQPQRARPHEAVDQAMSKLVLSRSGKQILGLVASSGRSLFLSGPSGNGKTVMACALVDALMGGIWIPYAIEVDGQVIRVFDEHTHRRLPVTNDEYDSRWVKIKPPLVVVGGELTIASLDLTTTETQRYYEAPVPVKSNGGVLVVDDLGRQRCSASELLNRWIIPLEQRIDYLTLSTGKKIRGYRSAGLCEKSGYLLFFVGAFFVLAMRR